MAAKITQRVFTGAASNPTFPHRFCLSSWRNNWRFVKKRFREFAKIGTLQVSGRLEDQLATNQFVLHFVKKGETLTSISRQYGVSIQSIAAVNAKLVDVDLVLEGQCLKIPSSRVDDSKMGTLRKSWLYCTIARDGCQSSLNTLNRHLTDKMLTMTSSHHLQLVKTTGYFLVLVPLIAFCIRCIITAFHHRMAGVLKHQDLNKSKARHNGSRSFRWKSALSDIREPELVDAVSRQDSDKNPPEDQPPVPFEEISDAYTKLEPAYEKFLSECGMSKWGYWRGGSPE